MPRQFEATGEISCQQVLERLDAVLDGDLSAPEAAAVEAHLAACPACAAELRLASSVRRELRAWPELDAPPDVLRKIRRDAETAGRFRARRRQWVSLAAALFAAVVLGAGLWWSSWHYAPADVGEGPQVADAATVAQATEEARYALAYLTRVHRRAGLKLREDLFVDRVARPTARGLARSLSPDTGDDTGDDVGVGSGDHMHHRS